MLNLHVGKTYEQALVKGRPGQDEFNKFLSPYGRFSSYRNPDGSKVAFDHCPTVEESNAQKIQIVGSIDDAVDAIGYWRDLLDLKHICFFFDYPGLTREDMNEQMHLVAEEVFPRLGETDRAAPAHRHARSSERRRAPALRDPGRRPDGRRPPRRGAHRGGRRRASTRSPTRRSIDLDGHLLLPAFVEPHAHLDKAFLSERIPNPTGDLMGAIVAMHAHRHLITDRRHHRARRARRAADGGATAPPRSAPTPTPPIENGLMSVEALAEVRRRVADVCDVQIVSLVTWPIIGSAGAESRALLRDALDAGADVVGGCPHLDDDPAAANETLLGIAAEHGRDVDLHTDETLDPRHARSRGPGPPGDRPAASPPGHRQPLRQPGDADATPASRRSPSAVADGRDRVIALPHTNLFLQGRDQQTAMPRALTAVARPADGGRERRAPAPTTCRIRSTRWVAVIRWRPPG